MLGILFGLVFSLTSFGMQLPSTKRPFGKAQSVASKRIASTLFSAIAADDSDQVEYCLERGDDPNECDALGHTPLNYVASSVLVAVAIPHTSQDTIHWVMSDEGVQEKACKNNKLKILTMLVAAGARADTPQACRENLFIRASRYGTLEEAKELIKAGADYNEVDTLFKHSALHASIFNNNSEMFQFLITIPGINLEQKSALGETPLHCAVRIQSIEMVTALIDKAVFPCPCNILGETPLYYAASGDYEIFSFLIRYDLIRGNYNNKSLLHRSLEHDATESAQCLLRYGANPHGIEGQQKSPLTIAREKGNRFMIRQLFLRGVKVENAKSYFENSPIIEELLNDSHEFSILANKIEKLDNKKEMGEALLCAFSQDMHDAQQFYKFLQNRLEVRKIQDILKKALINAVVCGNYDHAKKIKNLPEIETLPERSHFFSKLVMHGIRADNRPMIALFAHECDIDLPLRLLEQYKESQSLSNEVAAYYAQLKTYWYIRSILTEPTCRLAQLPRDVRRNHIEALFIGASVF